MSNTIPSISYGGAILYSVRNLAFVGGNFAVGGALAYGVNYVAHSALKLDEESLRGKTAWNKSYALNAVAFSVGAAATIFLATRTSMIDVTARNTFRLLAFTGVMGGLGFLTRQVHPLVVAGVYSAISLGAIMGAIGRPSAATLGIVGAGVGAFLNKIKD